MRFLYDIDELNQIRVWDTLNPNQNNAPFFFQPHWPDETPWTDKAEATAWVNLFIESLTSPLSEYLPGDSPSEPKRLRPEITGEDNASN